MRILVDCQAVLERSGGMRLFAEELLQAWSVSTDDDLTVLAPSWLDVPTNVRRSRIRLPNRRVLLRAFAQAVVTPVLFRAGRFDMMLSANSIISPAIPSSRAVVVAHDWRHLRRPAEFSFWQRLFRRWWSWSARRSGTVVTISRKTAVETAQLVGREDVAVIENGWDHSARWRTYPPDAETAGRFPHGYVLTFGHHSNKRPELAIEALSEVPKGLGLVVLGADGPYRDRLRDVAAEAAVEDRVLLTGFVDDDRYRALVSHARAVLLVSSDEGFGLPLTEALVLGIPAIAADDSGVGELFAGLVRLTAPEPAAIAETVREAIGSTVDRRPQVRTWRRAALEYSELIRRRQPGVPR